MNEIESITKDRECVCRSCIVTGIANQVINVLHLALSNFDLLVISILVCRI